MDTCDKNLNFLLILNIVLLAHFNTLSTNSKKYSTTYKLHWHCLHFKISKRSFLIFIQFFIIALMEKICDVIFHTIRIVSHLSSFVQTNISHITKIYQKKDFVFYENIFCFSVCGEPASFRPISIVNLFRITKLDANKKIRVSLNITFWLPSCSKFSNFSSPMIL